MATDHTRDKTQDSARLVPTPASSTVKRQAASAKHRAVQAESVTTGDWEAF
ncbi:hypothetical protein ACQ4WY_03750 [Janthinobacterium sp. LB2P49]|uniref:hypothetical protein n=1 Tax=Janthinobacterium sp. LB2P49 TaxID=3424198 RepID=UPI003F23E59B